jgi:hypothetical protein
MPIIIGFYNRASSVGERKKCEFALFSFKLGAFAFLFRARERESAKKVPALNSAAAAPL